RRPQSLFPKTESGASDAKGTVILRGDLGLLEYQLLQSATGGLVRAARQILPSRESVDLAAKELDGEKEELARQSLMLVALEWSQRPLKIPPDDSDSERGPRHKIQVVLQPRDPVGLGKD